jgi:hypothetical protein
MGVKLDTKRRHMSKMDLFRTMKWLETQSREKLLSENVLEIHARAVKELEKDGQIIKITDNGLREAMKSLGLKCFTSKVSGVDEELLGRVKRIEKFLAKFFAEEWANL